MEAQKSHELAVNVQEASRSYGCGKTTLLKAILGRLSVDHGLVHVFGKAPGPDHDVPGKMVGYMPQEYAMYQEFTIEECLLFHAKLHNRLNDFNERVDYLIDFLDLPEKSRKLLALSGGQKRRVSLAVALYHEPELLILDEPTVGIDPILRQKIWEKMLELKSMGVTIIITTHYINEAEQADVVGLMRNGKILAEGPPKELLLKEKKQNLEEVFLSVCRKQTKALGYSTYDGSRRDLITPHITSAAPINEEVKDPELESLLNARYTPARDLNIDPQISYPPLPWRTPRWQNVSALYWKAYKRMSRKLLVLLFTFLLPAIQITLFCIAIGPDPRHVPIAVSNLDVGGWISTNLTDLENQGYLSAFGKEYLSMLNSVSTPSESSPTILPTTSSPSGKHWGSYAKVFLNQTLAPPDDTAFKVTWKSSYEDSVQEVLDGNAWAAVLFHENYTWAVNQRMDIRNYPLTAKMVNESSVYLKMDMTNQQISYFTEYTFTKRYEQFFIQDVLKPNTHELMGLFKTNIVFGTHIYPPTNSNTPPKFTEFVAPGMIAQISFAQSIGMAAVSFVVDKKEGTLDRSWAAGVYSAEVICATVLYQLTVLTVQIALLLLVALGFFQLTCYGFVLTALLVAIFQGLVGMTYGMWISSLVDEVQDAIQMAIGTIFPALYISGVIWPLSASPKALQYIAYTLPTTWSAEAMRSVMSRGWGFNYWAVPTSLLVSSGWILLFSFLSARGIRSRD